MFLTVSLLYFRTKCTPRSFSATNSDDGVPLPKKKAIESFMDRSTQEQNHLDFTLKGSADEAMETQRKKVKEYKIKETCEASTQTNIATKEAYTQTTELCLSTAAEINRSLAEKRTVVDTHRLLLRTWPEECFRRTSVASKNFVRNCAENRAMLTTNLDKNSRLFRGLEGQYPYLENLDNLGTVTKMTSSTTIMGEDGHPKTLQRTMVLIKPDETQDPPEIQTLRTAEALLNAVGDIAHLDLLAPGKGTYMWRKALECALGDREVTITLCTKNNPTDQTEPQPGSSELQIKIEADETYAEFVEEFTPDFTEENIKTELPAISPTSPH